MPVASASESPASVSEPGQQSPSRRRLVIGAVVLLALIVRIAVVYRANRHAPNNASRLGGDEPEYDRFARNLLAGDWSDYPIRGPGYPVLLAALRLVTGGNYDAILYLQAVIGALTVVPAYLLARRIAGDVAGVVCALVIAVHWELALSSGALLSEVLFTPLLLVFLLLLLRALDQPSTRRWIGAGAALGACALTRPTMLPVTAVLAVMVVLMVSPRRVGVRAAGLLVATALLVVAPVTIANAIKFHAFVPVSTTTGVVWEGSPEYYELYRAGRSYQSIWANELNAQRNGGHSVSTPAGDAYFTRRGLTSIRAHPLTYLWYSAQKSVFFWLGQPSADWNGGSMLHPGALSYLPRWELGLTFLDRLLPIVAVAALAVLLVRRRHDRDLLVIYVVLATFTVLHAALWAELRLSQPLLPLLAVLVGTACAELLPRRIPPRRPERHSEATDDSLTTESSHTDNLEVTRRNTAT
jgi:4-amino-4-deoxy-L-arabinose transferase-like glycosyltransferase